MICYAGFFKQRPGPAREGLSRGKCPFSRALVSWEGSFFNASRQGHAFLQKLVSSKKASLCAYNENLRTLGRPKLTSTAADMSP